jgi:stearoyl-CoA desaturase (delta-9 desaturase)
MEKPIMQSAAKTGSRVMSLWRWFDSWAGIDEISPDAPLKLDWFRGLPFVLLHLVCLLVFWVGWSPTALILAGFLFLFRMFAITAFYHRYFSHRTYRTSRPMQFVFAILGNTTVQRGPLWWASFHRHHHRVADGEDDPHSPGQHGLMWSHMGWFLTQRNFPPRLDLVRDLTRFPELRFLDRFDTLVPAIGGILAFTAGEILRHQAPQLGTSGPQLLVWSIISTIVLFHASVTINSLAHCLGRRRYPTTDTSGNSFLLALLTFGEGWHNNHHFYQASTRQGHRWWEIDLTFYLLVMMSWTGLIWDLKPVPDHVLKSAKP